MMKITMIVGLSGSGKSEKALELARGTGIHIVDDISVDTGTKIADIITRGEKEIIITDPMACISSPEKVRTYLTKWFGEVDVTFIPFENDVEACLSNLGRRKDGRTINQLAVSYMSDVYEPTLWGDPIPVWKP